MSYTTPWDTIFTLTFAAVEHRLQTLSFEGGEGMP